LLGVAVAGRRPVSQSQERRGRGQPITEGEGAVSANHTRGEGGGQPITGGEEGGQPITGGEGGGVSQSQMRRGRGQPITGG
jgi:hypothetical protein